MEIKMLKITLVAFAVLVLACRCNGCSMANWWSSFDKKGYSNCGSRSKYINGFNRNNNRGKKDKIYLLEEARCCSRPRPYWNQPTQCLAADWVSALDRTYSWATCPSGFFLQGLYRGKGDWIHNIEYGKCCKPAKHPYYRGHCYEQNVGKRFDDKGTSKCKNGYFMTGLYRGSCDRLYCIEKFQCCKMYPKIPVLTSLSDAKTRVMDMTMYHLSKLAHYLGYGWCAGCRGQYVGEDFRRNGDKWEADKRSSYVKCSGYKSNHRLNINYGDFKFSVKDINYGKPVIQELQPIIFDSGRVRNGHNSKVSHVLERTISSVRTVTHTTTSSWKHSHELGIELSYTPPGPTGGVGSKLSYKFNYESSQTTTDSTSNQQSNTFKISSSTTIEPKSYVDWEIMMYNTRSTVPYTATVLVHFSAELQGFLRWGGGRGKDTNFHKDYYGSGRRPTVNYRFGDGKTPFYKALKQQSDRGEHPWLWGQMMNHWSSARPIINELTKETWYEFTLTGQFEDVIGKKADVNWKSNRKRSMDANKKDPPRVFPSPPKVVIDTGKISEGENIPVNGTQI